MANEYFTPSGSPTTGSTGASATMRAEFAAAAAGFDKLPVLAGQAYKVVYVNAAGAALTSVGGDGLLKLSTSGVPTVAVAGTDFYAPGADLALTFGKSLIFEGATDDGFETTLTAADPTADRTITLPNASGTVALTSDIPAAAPATPDFVLQALGVI